MAIMSSTKSPRAVEYDQKSAELEDFFRFYELPRELRQQTRVYLRKTFELDYFKAASILDHLSSDIKDKIAVFVKKTEVQRLPFFKKAPDAMLSKVVDSVQQLFFKKNDIVFKRGVQRMEHLYFVAHGELLATISLKSEAPVRAKGVKKAVKCASVSQATVTIGVGATFGYLHSTDITEGKVTALQQSEVFMLQKPKLLQLYSEFPAFEQSLKHRRGSLHTEFAQAVQRSVESESEEFKKETGFLRQSLSRKSFYQPKSQNSGGRFGNVKLQGGGWRHRKRSSTLATSVVPEVASMYLPPLTPPKASSDSLPPLEATPKVSPPRHGKLQKITEEKEVGFDNGEKALTAHMAAVIVRQRGVSLQVEGAQVGGALARGALVRQPPPQMINRDACKNLAVSTDRSPGVQCECDPETAEETHRMLDGLKSMLAQVLEVQQEQRKEIQEQRKEIQELKRARIYSTTNGEAGV
jgi:hypothetical protein